MQEVPAWVSGQLGAQDQLHSLAFSFHLLVTDTASASGTGRPVGPSHQEGGPAWVNQWKTHICHDPAVMTATTAVPSVLQTQLSAALDTHCLTTN